MRDLCDIELHCPAPPIRVQAATVRTQAVAYSCDPHACRCELQWPGSAARAGPARASTPPDRLQGASGVSGRSHSVRTTPFLSASAAINAAQRRSTSTGAVEYFPTSAGRRYR